MNSRLLLHSILGLGCAALILAVAFQAQTIASLHKKEREIRSQLAAQSSAASASLALAAETNTATNSLLSDREIMELMRLRNETAQLRKQQRELASAAVENTSLRAQIATNALAGGKGSLPPGYLRMRDAQFSGAGTPESTLQSFLYAVARRDTNALFRVFDDHMVQVTKAKLRDSTDSMWNEYQAIPGARVIKSTPRSDTEIVLDIEMVPGMVQSLVFVKSGSDWKLALAR